MPRMPWSSVGMMCLAALVMLLASVAFLVDWIRRWPRIKVFWEYGAIAGLGTLGYDLLMALLLLWAWLQASPGDGILAVVVLAVIAVAAAIDATRVGGITMLGMQYAAELGHPSFPWLQRWFGDAVVPGPTAAPQPAETAFIDAAAALPALKADGATVAVSTGATTVPVPSLRDTALRVLGVVAVGVAYSMVLFQVTSARTSDLVRALPGYGAGAVDGLNLPAILLGLGAACSEELFYRMGLQGFLARYLKWQGGWYWLAIVLSSAFWALGHAGVVEPEWVKLAQIFPTGLLLGWLYRRCGVGSCMVAHALFNLLMMLLPSPVIG